MSNHPMTDTDSKTDLIERLGVIKNTLECNDKGLYSLLVDALSTPTAADKLAEALEALMKSSELLSSHITRTDDAMRMFTNVDQWDDEAHSHEQTVQEYVDEPFLKSNYSNSVKVASKAIADYRAWKKG